MTELFAGDIRAAHTLCDEVMDEAVAGQDDELTCAAFWLLTPALRESGLLDESLNMAQRWVDLVPAQSVEEVPAWFAPTPHPGRDARPEPEPLATGQGVR
jgi:hypothetical protein